MESPKQTKNQDWAGATLNQGNPSTKLEVHLNSELDLAALAGGGRDESELAIIDGGIRHRVVAVVKQVEEFRPELDRSILVEGKVLEGAEVDVCVPRPYKIVPGLVTVRICGGLHECGRVEPLFTRTIRLQASIFD